MAKRLTQKEAIFFILYKNLKSDDPEKYIPVWQFMGEVYCEAVGKWGFVSHECSARASELKKDNPELIQRKHIVGRSGAKYYGYRINPWVTKEMINDQKLRDLRYQLSIYRAKKLGHDN